MTALARALLVLTLAPALAAQSDVVATLKGGTLTLKGSSGADDLTLGSVPALGDGDGTAEVLVTPAKGTTINGSTEPASFSAVKKLKANLGAGSDRLECLDLEFQDNPLTINLGPGDDHLILTNTTAGDVKFVGSSGHDTFEATGGHLGVTKVSGASGVLTMPLSGTFFSGLTVKSGPEVDVLNWNGITVDFDLKLNCGGGGDLLTFTDWTVGGQATYKLGPGNDHFTDDEGFYGAFITLDAGPGDDEVVWEDSTLGNALNVKLGGGLNELRFRAEDGSLTVGNSVTITGGPAVDTLELRVVLRPFGVTIGNDLIVALKNGANELEMSGDVSVGNDLLYTGGGLDDVVDVADSLLGNDVNLVLKNGFNTALFADCLIGNDLRITAGTGDDTVQLSGTTKVGGNTLINLGGGNNIQP